MKGCFAVLWAVMIKMTGNLIAGKNKESRFNSRQYINFNFILLYATEGALAAIRGQISAHSFATGPVMAEPE